MTRAPAAHNQRLLFFKIPYLGERRRDFVVRGRGEQVRLRAKKTGWTNPQKWLFHRRSSNVFDFRSITKQPAPSGGRGGGTGPGSLETANAIGWLQNGVISRNLW